MIFHANMIPFFLIGGILGAAYMGFQFLKSQRSVVNGSMLGLVAATGGPWLFMVPLQSCTFEPERTSTDFWIGIFFFYFGAALFVFIAQYMAQFFHPVPEMRPSVVQGQTSTGTFNSPWLVPGLLLLPSLAVLAMFLYYPAYETFRLSTFTYRLGAPRRPFKCVENFTDLISPEYGDIMLITVYMSAAIVIGGLVISLLIAYLAFQPVKGANVYRTMLIWPYAISPAIAGLIFDLMFDPQVGVIDNISRSTVGVPIPDWPQSPPFAQFLIIIASIWKTLGYNILFYLAGLQNIPKDLVEAAAIDGANGIQRFRQIIIPMLSPITFFLIITNLTYAFFETYGTIDYLTQGGPSGATRNAMFHIIETAKTQRSLGEAAAQSAVLFVIVILITLWQFRTSGRRVTYGA